jgi:TonB family protein
MKSIAIAVLCAGRLCAAQETDPMARIQAATALSSLSGVDAKPWHMKMALTVFDDKGKSPQDGSVEIWHSAGDQRELYTFGSAKLTTLLHDGKRYSVANGGELPFGAEDLVAQVLHPGPDADDLQGSKPELRKQKFGKVSLECIMLTQPSHGTDAIPLGLFPTYCLSPGDDKIRSSYNFGSRTVVINGLGKFLDHNIAMKLDLLDGQIPVGTASVESLSTYVPEAEEFTPTAEMIDRQVAVARVSGGVIAGTRVTFVQPVYPGVAKQNHESGTVVLRALIGRDGHIHSLRPVSVSNSDFLISAIAAVRQWTYKPYLLKGEPVEVDTTITVNYALSPGR